MARARTVFVNGAFVPESEASISIFDRGFLMGDAVYEVSAVIDGKMIDNEAHLHRLARSLGELNMPMPMSVRELVGIQEALISDNQLQEGILYIHVTRGSADRDFVFDPDMRQNIVMFTQRKNMLNDPMVNKGLRITTMYDIRWQRRDIKTTQLLAQSLAKMIARDAGYDDVWLVDDQGLITEGSSNNVWLLKGDRAFTRPLDYSILHGITRRTLIDVLADNGLTLVERPFTAREALHADEAFATSAGALIMPVVEMDGHAIGTGKPGQQTLALRNAYLKRVRQH